MWLFKLARIALLLGGACGLAEFGRRVKDRAGPPQSVERESSVRAGEDTGALPPDLVGRRVAIPALPPPVATLPSTADPKPEPPQVVRASFAPPELSPAVSPVAPARLLAPDEMKTWNSGRDHFDRKWTESEGLGSPGFNAESCGTCHNAPCLGGAGGNEFNVVHVQGAGGSGGSGRYGRIEKRGNQLTRMRELRKQLNKKQRRHIAFAEIQTPSLLGLGAIDTIPDSEILSREDPNDYDGDGIKGVARRHVVAGVEEIGRFGWKARTPRLYDFVCLALGGELGLTIPHTSAPDGERGFGIVKDGDKVKDPELPLAEFEELVFFIAHLAPPEGGSNSNAYDVSVGRHDFDWIGCSACHVPVLMGSDGPVNLYSDLLLHEVLATPEASQSGRRGRGGEAPEPTGFRTPPLWGIGQTAPYMHDGRSATLLDAILAHEQEGAASRDRFLDLEEADQLALIAFLLDL